MSGFKGGRRVGISMPILNQSYEQLAELAELADEAGFDSVWDYEFYRNPFVIHGYCARQTTTIHHATGTAAAAGRSPFEMANAAADVDEISKGRTILGLSTGAESWTDIQNGADVSHALPRLREYIECLRATWKYLGDGEPFSYDGRFYSAGSPAFNPWGLRPLARPQVPIYLCVVRPRMLQLAGEVGDGVLPWLSSPKYLAEVVLPNVELGAKRAGRDRADVDVAALVLCSVHEDRDEAIRRARINVGQYLCFPGAAPMAEFNGFADIRTKMVERLMSEGLSAFEALPEEVVKMLAICGTPSEGREQLAEYEAVLDHVVLHTPYTPPLEQAESEDIFRNTVAAFAPGR